MVLPVMALALASAHCSSEEPAPRQDDAVIDNHPGDLVITSPKRAAFIEGDDGADVEIEGTGATSELTINGQRADVSADGSFHAKVKATAGLNIVKAADGESRLETPFLFGHFVSKDTPVARAAAIQIGPEGMNGAAPLTSLSSITNQFLDGQDLMKAVKGKTFSGTIPGGSWSYKVTDAKYSDATAAFAPGQRGVDVDAALKDVEVDGTLTMTVFSKKYTGPVKMTADRATITGDVELSVDADEGKLSAKMPTAEANLENFKFDSNNAGFPCCVDSIAKSFLEPKIEEAIRDQVKEIVPSSLALTLDGVGLPKELDLSAAGIARPIAVTARLDDATFDQSGGNLSAAILFGDGSFGPTTPGFKAPGWLKLGGEAARARPVGLGVSFSLDAVNQLFFAAWGTGALTRSLPDAPPVTGLKLDPALPPVLLAADGGALRVALGEVVVNAAFGGGEPFTAAVSITQDVVPGTEGQDLVLTPKGEPELSITWLDAENVADGVRTIIAAAAKEQIQKFLKPIKIPFPAIGLDKLGASFAGKSLTLAEPTVAVDRASARVSVAGSIALVTSAAKK